MENMKETTLFFGDYILESDFSSLPINESKLFMAIKYRYGIGVDRNLTESKNIIFNGR